MYWHHIYDKKVTYVISTSWVVEIMCVCVCVCWEKKTCQIQMQKKRFISAHKILTRGSAWICFQNFHIWKRWAAFPYAKNVVLQRMANVVSTTAAKGPQRKITICTFRRVRKLWFVYIFFLMRWYATSFDAMLSQCAYIFSYHFSSYVYIYVFVYRERGGVSGWVGVHRKELGGEGGDYVIAI